MKKQFLHTLAFAILLGSLVVGGQLLSSAAFAQDATPSPSPTAATTGETVPVDTIFIKPQQPERIKTLLKLYQDQVEQYRNLEREYQISKAQFFKLNTLQSLEESVVNTRKTMVSRDEVLITYCELLHASLTETEGVDVAQKAKALDDLTSQINVLKDHKKKLEETKDREGIAIRVKEFEVGTAQQKTLAYTTRALISLGELQAVYDKAVILFGEIKVYHTEKTVSGVKQEERARAYREVDRAIETTEKSLTALRLKISGASAINEVSYDTYVGKEMSTIYAQDSQLINFLNELVLELS
jgi:hypothetical protein